MQNDRRQFHIFDLELAARKAGATIPSMDVALAVFAKMHTTQRTYAINNESATMLIGDIAVDSAKKYATLLIRLSDTTAPNSVYSDPSAGKFQEHVKTGRVGSDFGCHVFISTEHEKGLPNTYTCAIERISGLPHGLVRRLLSKFLSYEYNDNKTFFSYPSPAGGRTSTGQPRMERCCPHVELRGRPSQALADDINNGRLSGVTLVRAEAQIPIGGAPYLKKSTTELNLNVIPDSIPAQVWDSLTDALRLQSSKYRTAKVRYRLPHSKSVVTVELDTKTAAPLTDLYILSFEITGIYPLLAQSTVRIVDHLRKLAEPEFLTHRNL